VYNFDRSTEYGTFDHPSQDLTRRFLDLVHYDKGGRIFTYVLTLDALWRFTETGKEFGIDMLSKHTMHSDVSIYIAFSGEFFVRRLKHANRAPPEEGGHNKAHPPDEISGGPPDEDPPKDPAYYELIIDNDSGTYRPNAKLLPLLKQFLEHNLPGLRVETLDCQADADKMQAMKQEQRDRKQKEGGQVFYTQLSRSSSESSSDEEALDALERTGQLESKGVVGLTGKEAAHKQQAKLDHLKAYGHHPGKSQSDGVDDTAHRGHSAPKDAPIVGES
jgi:hypothetical protein